MKDDGRILMQACRYLEDLAVGQRYESGTYTVSAHEIKAFASRFDPQSFHLDDDQARASFFGGLAGSGWHTAAITMRLLVSSGPRLTGGLIGLSSDVSWLRPTRPGDILQLRTRIADIHVTDSHPDRGIVTLQCRTLNQHGQVVQKMKAKILVFKRAAGIKS